MGAGWQRWWRSTAENEAALDKAGREVWALQREKLRLRISFAPPTQSALDDYRKAMCERVSDHAIVRCSGVSVK